MIAFMRSRKGFPRKRPWSFLIAHSPEKTSLFGGGKINPRLPFSALCATQLFLPFPIGFVHRLRIPEQWLQISGSGSIHVGCAGIQSQPACMTKIAADEYRGNAQPEISVLQASVAGRMHGCKRNESGLDITESSRHQCGSFEIDSHRPPLRETPSCIPNFRFVLLAAAAVDFFSFHQRNGPLSLPMKINTYQESKNHPPVNAESTSPCPQCLSEKHSGVTRMWTVLPRSLGFAVAETRYRCHGRNLRSWELKIS